ncbi:CaiB/BaiF CoA transferase family protein [Profundibacterium mesophilum]|uniref:Alpha-methylacyl-CoA racemase n=1 Tax=Profundibacterium mesophilum KAUST100406-0324 TaxID=1037889 RepID=A0A921NU50_9RHOB|nr:CaiB/BaiF CoA-transferase family protein [Profundibacterium mesophilum]KAF0676684.1 alpha-methylacyl-CoA racemase [Profundibacterium mesophilum KAUST100406-0324]
MSGTGPLDGIEVLEFDAIGPVPFCAMMLADHGARITRVTRPGGQPGGIDAGDADMMLRGRAREVPLDLKSSGGRAAALELVAGADILLEGFRPGVMERLGLDPAACAARNRAIVYCRLTGYGQDGPLATHPGHDINYIAQSGALHAMGRRDAPPPPPLSLVGDFGGGGMMAAFAVLAALLAARTSGRGAVIDAAMADGAALLMALSYGLRNAGIGSAAREANLLDGAAPFYRCYATRDEKFIAAGALEPKFYAAMRRALGLDAQIFDAQMDRERWPEMAARIARIVAARDMAAWRPAIADPDACLSEVLDMDAAARGGHLRARGMLGLSRRGIELGRAPRIDPLPGMPGD